MASYLILLLGFAWLAILVGCWLGWQLLRQNGRILLRLDELEKQLHELEFGEPDPHPNGAAATDDPADRFKLRSLAHSKIKRDGLKAGTLAPDFTLPRLDGRGDLTLSTLRGKPVLLVFSSPGCGPCNMLAPELEKLHREQLERAVGRVTPCAPQRNGMFRNGAQGTDAPYPITVVMISKGEPEENRAKVKEHGLTFPVVLQQQWEISRRYAMFATPIAYLIDQAGIITHDVAVGVEQILKLVATRDGIPDNHEPTMAGRRNQLVGVH